MHNYLDKKYKILAIETSCDETAAAVLSRNSNQIKVLSNVVASQIALHRATFGVVPEVAARAHIRKIGPVVRKALADASCKLAEIDYIAATVGPGLVPSLLVGVEYAKALAAASGKKFIAENHMLGHLYSAFLKAKVQLPSINLIVSGGHTYLIRLDNQKYFTVIGQTVDDAAGEAFDKVAKMLELGYPGGPEVSTWAERAENSGRENRKVLKGRGQQAIDYNFPRPMLHAKNYDFSFAGLKTAVLYKIRNERLNIHDSQVRANICFSFQNAVVDVLVAKTLRAAKEFQAKSITLSGGVAANKKLRAALGAAAKKTGCKFFVPEFSLCTDNALMIANAAAIRLEKGYKFPALAKIKVDPNLPLR